MIEPQAGPFLFRKRLAIHLDAIRAHNIYSRTIQAFAIQRDSTGSDHGFGFAARSYAGASQTLGDPLALLGRRFFLALLETALCGSCAIEFALMGARAFGAIIAPLVEAALFEGTFAVLAVII
jgi:hypothetical protein